MNATITKNFFKVVDARTKAAILANIADNYGISKDEVIDELYHSEAEHLLDYLNEPVRSATKVLMIRHATI